MIFRGMFESISLQLLNNHLIPSSDLWWTRQLWIFPQHFIDNDGVSKTCQTQFVRCWRLIDERASGQPAERACDRNDILPTRTTSLKLYTKKWKNIIFSRCIGAVGLTMNCCLDNSHGILLYYKHITWDRKSILCVVDIFWNHFTVYMFKSVKCLFISLVGWSMIVGRDCSCILSSYGTVVRGEHPAVLYVTLSQALISVSFPLKTQFWNVSPGITPVWSLMLRLSLLFSVGLFNVRHIWTNQSSVGAVTEKKKTKKKKSHWMYFDVWKYLFCRSGRVDLSSGFHKWGSLLIVGTIREPKCRLWDIQ